jgi:hypothetical protein
MNAQKTYSVRRLHQGLALLEIIGSIAILSGILAGLASLTEAYFEELEDKAYASYLMQYSDVASDYINQNYSRIFASSESQTVLLQDTELGPILASRGLSRSPMGYPGASSQNICVVIRRETSTSTIPGTDGRLLALVHLQGGPVLPPARLGNISLHLGAAGGIKTQTAFGVQALGTKGIWSIGPGPLQEFSTNFAVDPSLPFASPTCGPLVEANRNVMALWISKPQNPSYLYRSKVDGHPDLNTMTTPLKMNAVRTVNADCSDEIGVGAIAREDVVTTTQEGRILSCVKVPTTMVASGWAWRPVGGMWRDPVMNFSELPADDPDYTVRMVVNGHTTLGSSTSEAFMKRSNLWMPLAADQNGRLIIQYLDASKLVRIGAESTWRAGAECTNDVHGFGAISSEINSGSQPKLIICTKSPSSDRIGSWVYMNEDKDPNFWDEEIFSFGTPTHTGGRMRISRPQRNTYGKLITISVQINNDLPSICLLAPGQTFPVGDTAGLTEDAFLQRACTRWMRLDRLVGNTTPAASQVSIPKEWTYYLMTSGNGLASYKYSILR